MKATSYIRSFSLGCSLALCGLNLNAQTHSHAAEVHRLEPHTCGVTDEVYRVEIMPRIQESFDQLQSAGMIMPEVYEARSIGSLHWPLRMAPHYENLSGVNEAYSTGNYTDLAPGLGREDWMCFMGPSARNYNGHTGADIGLGIFSWWMQSEGNVDVIAAADGQVVWRHDGAFDRNCGGPLGTYNAVGTDPDRPWAGNYLALLHAGGSVTLYLHLKNGSVANLQIGDHVTQGQYLGKVGSSGNSTGPHIHFEARTSINGSWVEPWFTDNGCNYTTSASWWVNQKPYVDTSILRVMTASASPPSLSCTNVEDNNSVEVTNEVNHFAPLSNVQVRAVVRDRPGLSFLTVRVYNSSNTLLHTFTDNLTLDPDVYYGTWWWGWNFPSSLSTGIYRVEATLGSEVVNHYFTVGCQSTFNLSTPHLIGPKAWIASGQITSSQAITGLASSDVRYESGSFIQFNPGFVAAQGSTVKTRIDGCSLGSNLVAFEAAVDPEPEVLLSSFEVYPNPTLGEFTVAVQLDADVAEAIFTIRNSLGQVVETRRRTSYHTFVEYFDVKQMAAGFYLVEFQSGNTRKIKKLVVQ